MRITGRWRITIGKPGKGEGGRTVAHEPGECAGLDGGYPAGHANRAELEKVKKWEAKCEKQAERFAKAAEWTEARFHLRRP